MTPRLKSIELQGYKTFANKVRFEFPAQITAIVGPNGSGKSNIADSIRWVLGEQSYSVLRGRKTMDMIFTGSDQKARAGMASASILFNNQDYWLPIDFEEVLITRRAFRDGGNEYSINGQKVRLKDVNELLGQSGLSERTYTIIGQGLIDNALSLKPDDRRSFFEEAAGIGLFRSRREEALGRLDVTRRNMERITDILSELEPRVHSLERQAKKAGEYEQIKDGLKGLLREWYGYHWHKGQQLLISAVKTHHIQEEKTNQIRLEFSEFEKNLIKLQENVRDTRLNLSLLHNRLSEAHHRLEQSTRQAAVLDERLNAAKEQVSAQMVDSDSLNADLELLQNRKEEAGKELTALQEASAEALKQKSQFEKELQGKQDEIRLLENERSEKGTALNKIENSLIRLNTRQEELQIQLESLSQSIEKLKNTLAETEFGLTVIRNEYTVYETNAKQAEFELNSSMQKQTEVRETLKNQEKQRSFLLTERSKAETDHSRCSAQFDVLENADRSLAGLNQGAQFLVKISKQGKLKQNLRSLGSQFIVPKKYEVAVASALGEYLDAVLLDQNDWQFTMDLLCSGNNGRAVLISEEFDSNTTFNPKNASLRDIPSLLDFIECKDEIRPLAERLFRNIFLAESREQALALQSSLLPDQTLVTLSGDTFRANGSVISGNETKFQVLARSREKQELLEKMAAANKSAGEIIGQLQELEVSSSVNRKLDDQITAEITQNRTNLESLRKKGSQLTIEIQKQEQTIVFLNQRILDSEKKMQDAANAINQDQAESKKLEGERIVLQEALRELSASIHKIQLDELQNQVHHWTLEWTVAEKTIQEVQTRLSDLNTRILKDQQKSQQNEERITGIHRQIEEIVEQKTALQQESTDVFKLVESIEIEVAPEEILLSNFETELNTAQTENQTFRLKMSAAEKALTQTQLEVSRMKDNLDILKGKIEADFGLVAFDYSAQIPGQTPLPLGDMVDELPQIEEIPAELDEQISRQKSLLYRMGSINPESISEYKTVRERFLFLKTQKTDLEKADSDLRKVIDELDGMMKNAFQDTFEKVQTEFKAMFTRLFGGGSAKLILTDPDDLNQSGIDIEAKLPGHREQELSLLSGGERSLTSVALIFALLRVSPTPFCVLDEVDAALDEANVGRFCELLKELGNETQFIVITHNRNTVETADVIYGITMGRDSASQSVSLRLDEVNNDVLN